MSTLKRKNNRDAFANRYRVVRKLGSGGTAEVYLVEHRDRHTQHAMKVLRVAAPTMQMRLLQEGQMQARLTHPNVVAVSDIIRLNNGVPALIMDFVCGPSLAVALETLRPSIDQVDALARGILSGLAAAHARMLVHRDLKPANILLSIENGDVVPRIADFGVAKRLNDERPAHTRTGTVMGTPRYMAPEQFRNAKEVDHRADLFSAGALLYQLATGKHLVDTADFITAYQLMIRADYPPVETLRPELPQRMVRAIGLALRVDLDERVSTASELLDLWCGDVVAPLAVWRPDELRALELLGRQEPTPPTLDATRLVSAPNRSDIHWLSDRFLEGFSEPELTPAFEEGFHAGRQTQDDVDPSIVPFESLPESPPLPPGRRPPFTGPHPNGASAPMVLLLVVVALLVGAGGGLLWSSPALQPPAAAAPQQNPLVPIVPPSAPTMAPEAIPEAPIPSDWLVVPSSTRSFGGSDTARIPATHIVTVAAFSIAPAPLTWAEWESLGGTASGRTGPVTGLAPRQIASVLNDASRRLGLAPALTADLTWNGGNGLRLPTEAEWEVALSATPPAELEHVIHPEPLPVLPGRDPIQYVLRGETATERVFTWRWDPSATFRLVRGR